MFFFSTINKENKIFKMFSQIDQAALMWYVTSVDINVD